MNFSPLLPSDGPLWLPAFARSIADLFRRVMPAPLRLFSAANADLPPAADYTGGLAWNATSLTVNWSDGTGWRAPQPADARLDAIAGLTPAANQVIYWTSATAAAMTGLTAFGRSLIDDADSASGRTTLGLGTAAVKDTGTSGNTVPLLDGANSWSGAQAFAAAVTANAGLVASNVSIVGSSPAASLQDSDSTGNAATSVFNGRDSANAVQWRVGRPFTTVLRFENLGGSFGWYNALGSGQMMLLDATGIDLVGLMRCDSLRIDVAPTAAAVAQTHHVPVNINGTTYKLLLAS